MSDEDGPRPHGPAPREEGSQGNEEPSATPDADANPDPDHGGEPDHDGGTGSPSGHSAPIGRAELQHRAVSGSVWTAVHTVFSTPVNFAANLVVARLLGPAGYGVVAVYTLAYALGLKASEAGYNGATGNWGTAAEARGDHDVATRLIRQAVGWQLLVEVPVLGAIVLAISWGHSPAIVASLLVAVVVGAALSGLSHAIMVENLTAAAARVTMVANLVLQIVVVAVALKTRDALAVFAARTLITALMAVPLVLPLGRSRTWQVLKPLVPRNMPEGFWKFAGLTTVTALLAALAVSRTEVFVLDIFHDRATVGYFALGYGLASQLTNPIDAVIMPLGIGILGLVTAAPHRARAVLLRATRYTATGTGVLTAIALPVVTVLVPVLYGRAYDPVMPIVIPLGIASCLVSLHNPLMSFVTARRRADIELRAMVVALVVDGVLSFALIPVIGVWGAVVANILGGLAYLPLLLTFELHIQHTPVTSFLGSTLAWLVSLPAAGIAVGAALLVGHGPFVEAAMGAVVGAVLFVAAVRLVRAGFAEDDREGLLASVPTALRRPIRAGFALLGTGRP
jgi:O-antigen/teichoic acid export membrane protein